MSELLNIVGLPASFADRYPHELSGGQKQRVTIARAISIEPELVILDEPTASLDVISQRSILHLLEDLRDHLDLSYLFISHDLTAVKELSQRIMVMKHGEVVDMFPTEELFHLQRNAYTKELVSIF
ncbi:ATP-binding cassette domain-containing protein [Priestia flexa]